MRGLPGRTAAGPTRAARCASSPEVFSFGNLVGDTGGEGGDTGWHVNALDLGQVKRGLNAAASISSKTDVNRDGRVNALDLGIQRALNLSLASPLVPAPAAAVLAVPPAPLFSDGDGKSARLLDELLA